MLKKTIVTLAAGLMLATGFQAHAAKTVIAINCGGNVDAYPFVADRNFVGGSTAGNSRAITIPASITNPAPVQVYQSERWGVYSYNFAAADGLVANKTNYKVRLHFAENYDGINTVGQRTFGVLINRQQVLTNLDVYSETGGRDIALVKEYDVATTGSAQITITTVKGADNPKIDGIEIIDPDGTPSLLKMTPSNAMAGGFTQHETSVSLSLYNLSASPVTVNGFRIDGPNVFTRPTAPLTIAANTTSTIYVRCRSSFAGTYTGTLWADYNTSTASVSSNLTFQCSDYVKRWTDADIGGAAPSAGSADIGATNITIKGGGADVWNTADQFNFMYASAMGNFPITVNVASMTATNPNGWAKAGVMIRESAAANAKYVILFVSPSNGIALQYRGSTGGGAAAGPTATGITAPVKLRLVRSGSTFTGSYSKDNGVTWTSVGSVNVAMSPVVVTGLCVTSHDTANLLTAVFDSLDLGYADNPSLVVNPVKNWIAFE